MVRRCDRGKRHSQNGLAARSKGSGLSSEFGSEDSTGVGFFSRDVGSDVNSSGSSSDSSNQNDSV